MRSRGSEGNWRSNRSRSLTVAAALIASIASAATIAYLDPQSGGTNPAGFHAIAASSSSIAMKAPPIASGRGDTVLTLPTACVSPLGQRSRAATSASASAAGRRMSIGLLMSAQYITGSTAQQDAPPAL